MQPYPEQQLPLESRQPVHASITSEQISMLVERFYESVRADERLGPIFAAHISGEWDEHLQKMKAFWRSVLLKTGEYKGRPVPAHAKITGVETIDFGRWLTLFERTARTLFEPAAVPLISATAERIATSLWLAMNPDPFLSPPIWSHYRT